jgi:ferritin
MDNQQDDTTAQQAALATATKEVKDLFTLENLIKTHISHIEAVRVELAKHSEMLTDILNNDTVYKEVTDQIKEITKKKTEAKQNVLKTPSNASLNQKIKDMRTEVKELKMALSQYLQQYQKIADTDQIESEDGEVRQIIFDARLVKISGKLDK